MSPGEHDRIRFDDVLVNSRVEPRASYPPSVAADQQLATVCPASRRNGWTYLSHAAIHPSNLLMLIGVMFMSLILWSVPVLVVGFGIEVVFLAVVPRRRFFRRRVDALLDEAERAAAAKARESLILQMSDGHRLELAKLEILIGKVRENVRRRDGRVRAADTAGLERLTSCYIRLAIAHRACEDSLAMTNQKALDGTIRLLEAAEMTAPERTRRLVRRRLSIAHRRGEVWGRTRESLDAIGHQLATITELCQLVHQESITPTGAPIGIDEIDRCLEELEENEIALRELADLGIADALEVRELDPGPSSYAPRPEAAVTSSR